jgi:tetratricopeptide (TPR) repeat protein
VTRLALVSLLLAVGCASAPPLPAPDRVALASGLVERKLYRVARGQLEAAERENGATAASGYLLGTAERELGDLDAALASFDAALAREPRSAVLHHGRARTLDRLGRREDAWAAYRSAIELDPARASFHNDLGFSLLVAGRPAEAEEALRTALEIDAGFAPARTNLALAVLLDGRDEEAIALLRRSHAPAALRNDLGALRELRGERAAAVEAYREALRITPGFAPARRNLDRLGEPADGADPSLGDFGEAQRRAADRQVIDPAAPRDPRPSAVPGDVAHEIYRERYVKDLVEQPERDRNLSQEVQGIR